MLDEADITSEETIEALSSFHIWSDSYIKERRNWMSEKPMKAVLLRVYKIPEKEIPEYQGCKSWININEEILEGQSVLNSEDIQSNGDNKMNYNRLGKSDIKVSELGFGAWAIALDWWGKKIEEDEAKRMLKKHTMSE